MSSLHRALPTTDVLVLLAAALEHLDNVFGDEPPQATAAELGEVRRAIVAAEARAQTIARGRHDANRLLTEAWWVLTPAAGEEYAAEADRERIRARCKRALELIVKGNRAIDGIPLEAAELPGLPAPLRDPLESALSAVLGILDVFKWDEALGDHAQQIRNLAGHAEKALRGLLEGMYENSGTEGPALPNTPYARVGELVTLADRVGDLFTAVLEECPRVGKPWAQGVRLAAREGKQRAFALAGYLRWIAAGCPVPDDVSGLHIPARAKPPQSRPGDLNKYTVGVPFVDISTGALLAVARNLDAAYAGVLAVLEDEGGLKPRGGDDD